MKPFAKSGPFRAADLACQQRSPKVSVLCNPTRNSSRKDWHVYIANLSQRAGVVRGLIRQLVLKELVDNALDEMDRVGRPGEVTISQDGEHTYTVTDQGRGFGDSPEELAYRFSIAKPMVSLQAMA